MSIIMRIVLLILAGDSSLLPQSPATAADPIPAVITFVAPAYPRLARDARIMGRTLTRITINRDGAVTEVKTIRAHRVFEAYVLEALRHWRFQPSDQEHQLEVTCSFEIPADGPCEGTVEHPMTSETHVSADLPSVVHIRTSGLPCVEVSDSDVQR